MKMEGLDLFLVATNTIGFICVCSALIKFLKWVWVVFLRPPKNLKEYGSWAIITGSTDGIGKAMAFELASKGLNLLLVGRNPLKLEATSKEIRDRLDVEVKFVVIDMQKVKGEGCKNKEKIKQNGKKILVWISNIIKKKKK